MIFITIGTLFEFDRLVKAIDNVIPASWNTEDFYAQIGPGKYRPKNMPYIDYLPKNEFDKKIKDCHAIISHAGMGSIKMAIHFNKPLLVMPRLKKCHEHVNDHQLYTAQRFEQLGHLLAAYSERELEDKIRQLKTFIPRPRIPNRQGVIGRVRQFLLDMPR